MSVELCNSAGTWHVANIMTIIESPATIYPHVLCPQPIPKETKNLVYAKWTVMKKESILTPPDDIYNH